MPEPNRTPWRPDPVFAAKLGLCRSCYNRRHSDPEIAELVAQAKDERRAAS